MENAKDLVLGNICPCLVQRCRPGINIPNFVRLNENGFQIVDVLNNSQSDDMYNTLGTHGNIDSISHNDILGNNNDEEFNETNRSDLSIENAFYEYGNIKIYSTLNADVLKRNESRYRVMMSFHENEEFYPPIDINELASFVPNFILNDLMNSVKNVNSNLDNDSIVSLKTLEYDAVVIFCDANGFSSLADSLCRSKCGANKLGNCLNKFLDPLIDTIYSWGGEILSFSGDAVTACWLISPSDETNNESDIRRVNSGLRALACCGEVHLGLNEFPTPVADKVLSLHIGVGYGQLKLTPIKVDQSSAISFIITGSSIIEATKGEIQASSGETVIGPSLFEILKNNVRTAPLESGWHKIKHVTCSLPVYPEKKNDNKFDKNALPLLEQLINPTIFNIACSGCKSYSNEMRRISAVFVGLRYTSLLDSNIEDCAAKLHIECKKISSSYGGALNKIIVDDKGIVALLLFGLPPDYRLDYATRAVNAARKIVAKCGTSAGVVTGYAWCGLVGNNRRKEYTALGDLINLSARLMGLANDGQVLVDHATFKRVKKIPLVLSTHKKVKGKTGNLEIYQVDNEHKLISQNLSKKTNSSNCIPQFVGRLTNWKNWPFRKNISRILDPLILKGGVKNIIATKGEGLTEAILLTIDYFEAKNWLTLRIENGNWKGLIDKILSKDKISSAKQLLVPGFHSRLGALFDSPLFDEDKTMLKKFSFGLELERARKFWGSPYEVLIEIFRGYAKSFGSLGIVIIVETCKDDQILEDIIKAALFENTRIPKVAILTLGKKRMENVPTSIIAPLSLEESKHLAAHILRKDADSADIKLLSEYAYKISGGSSHYFSQTIRLLITKGIVKWEKMNYSEKSKCENEDLDDGDSGMYDDKFKSNSDSDSDSDFSVSLASEGEFSLEDLETINDDCSMENIEEYGDIILKESLDTAPIIESMWAEAIEIVDNLSESLLEEAISISLITEKISPESVESKILENLEREGIIRIKKDTDTFVNTSYMLANEAIRRILTEKHIASKHGPCKCGKPCVYRCPGCATSLCSLKCSKEHKISCKQVRNKFDFLPLSQMDENTLIQDYRFLEKMSVSAEAAARSSLYQLENISPSKNLLKACANRNIKLKSLPVFFKRSRENTTRVEKDTIFWKILWTINIGSQLIELNDCVNENIKIKEALERVLVKGSIEDKRPCSVFLVSAKNNENEGTYEIENFKCELDSSLSEILKGKYIIEHPCLIATFGKNE